jgi:cell division protein FtsX
VLPAQAAAAAPAAAAAAGGMPAWLLLGLQLVAFGVALRLAFLARAYVRAHTARAVDKFKAQWKGALFIPVCAAVVGWVTNWIAVQARSPESCALLRRRL